MPKFRKCILLDKIVSFEECKECEKECQNLDGKTLKINEGNKGIVVK